MTFTMDQFVIASLIMVFLLGLLIMIPASSRRGRQRRPRKERAAEEPKDWQGGQPEVGTGDPVLAP